MTAALEVLLSEAIDAQRARMRGYELPSMALTVETLRAIDYAFCRELYPELPTPRGGAAHHEQISRWGVNEALSRVLPRSVEADVPQVFQSTRRSQEAADEFLLDAGVLAIAERQQSLLKAGFLRARLDHRKVAGSQLLVLTACDSTLYTEQVGVAGVTWLSNAALLRARQRPPLLRVRYRQSPCLCLCRDW